MQRGQRKTAPKVVDGKVQHKNRRALTPDYYNTPQDVPAIDRLRPGPGYRHLLSKRNIIDFVSIVPEWEELSRGLDVVQLAPGASNCDGWYAPGIVAICAWGRTVWRHAVPEYVVEHGTLFERLQVTATKHGGVYRLEFTEASARAYQLLHVLLHELGHHHDRMTTKSKLRSARGEGYAERWALENEARVFESYGESFGLV